MASIMCSSRVGKQYSNSKLFDCDCVTFRLVFRATTQKSRHELMAKQVLDCSWSCLGNLSAMQKQLTLDSNTFG